MEELTYINPDGLRTFFRHVCKVQRKVTERDFAEQKLQRKIQDLKRTTLGNGTKRKIVYELNELNKHVNNLVNKERDILGYAKKDDQTNNEIINSLLLNGQKMDALMEDINNLEGRLDKLSDLKLDRELRFKKLEKKIRDKTKKHEATEGIKQQIERLEFRCSELLKDPVYPKNELKAILDKINLLKLKLL